MSTLSLILTILTVVLLAAILFVLIMLKRVLKPILKLVLHFAKAYSPDLMWKLVANTYAIFAAIRGEKEYLNTVPRHRPLDEFGKTEEIVDDEGF